MAIERRKLSTLIALAVISSFFVNSTNADACDPNPCKNGGRCSEDFDGEAECRCRNKFFGKTCLDACEDNSDMTSCGIHGTCEHRNCTCTSAKYFGPHCEEKCEDYCKGDHTKCVLEPGRPIADVTCVCDGEHFVPITNTGFAVEWEGCRKANCRIDVCNNMPNTKCIEDKYKTKVSCICQDDYKPVSSSGDVLDKGCTRNKCNNTIKCQNGGNCDEKNEKCVCPDGLEGVFCEFNCAAECPKADNLTCAKDGNGFKCTCRDDTFSPNDIKDILKGCFKDPCKKSPCGKNGNCQTTSDTGYRCTCDSGYYGVHCSAGRLPIYILQKTINIVNCINCNVSK